MGGLLTPDDATLSFLRLRDIAKDLSAMGLLAGETLGMGAATGISTGGTGGGISIGLFTGAIASEPTIPSAGSVNFGMDGCGDGVPSGDSCGAVVEILSGLPPGDTWSSGG
jgi:hypothetical protein